MDHCVKGPHDCLRVPISHLVMIASSLLEITRSKCLDLVRADIRCDRGGRCQAFMSLSLNMCLYLSSWLQPRLCSSVQLFSSHLCDSHVRYDLSHSISPHVSLQAFRAGMTLSTFGFCAPSRP